MGTYIYPTRGIFEDLFCIFCWWDMLVPWKVLTQAIDPPKVTFFSNHGLFSNIIFQEQAANLTFKGVDLPQQKGKHS